MQPTNETDYKKLFTQLVKKQMLVLGPDITLAKARNVAGLTVDVNGEVQKIEGDPQVLLQGLINQFVELSGMIVKKTMESILTSYPGMVGFAAGPIMGVPSIAASAQAPIIEPPTQPQIGLQQSSVDHDESPKIEEEKQDPLQEEKKPVEPPPMTAMNLESLNPHDSAPTQSAEKKADPGNFTSQEMADLNKALENLSKAPLSSENQPQNVNSGQ